MALPPPYHAGEVRRGLASGALAIKGDAGRTVDAMSAAADSETPPFRLALGSIAYQDIARESSRRLDTVEAQRDVAYSADQRGAAEATGI